MTSKRERILLYRIKGRRRQRGDILPSPTHQPSSRAKTRHKCTSGVITPTKSIAGGEIDVTAFAGPVGFVADVNLE